MTFPPGHGPKLTSREGRYFGAMPEPPEGTFRARIGLYERTATAGGRPDGPWRPLEFFDSLFVLQIGDADQEVVDQLLTDEAEKLILNDRIVRSVTLTGLLFDTADDAGLAAWKRFYEQARISAVAKRGRLVRVDVLGQSYYGAFSGHTVAVSADREAAVDAIVTMVCTDVQPYRTDRAILEAIPGTDVLGWLTAEGAAAAGLTGRVPAAPVVLSAAEEAVRLDPTPVGGLPRRTVLVAPGAARFGVAPPAPLLTSSARPRLLPGTPPAVPPPEPPPPPLPDDAFVTLATDPTVGLYVQRIGDSAFHFDLLPEELARVHYYEHATRSYRFTSTATMTLLRNVTVAGVTTVAYALGGWLEVTFTIAVSADHRELEWSYSFYEQSELFSLSGVELTRLRFQAPSGSARLHFVNPVYDGFVVPDCTDADVSDNGQLALYSAPSAMQFCAIYDTEARYGLYMQAFDDQQVYKQYSFQGLGGAFRLFWTHYPAGELQKNKAAAQPYRFITRIFPVRAYGTSGYWDAYDLYKTWATDPARPWLPVPWQENPEISQRVKDEQVLAVMSVLVARIRGFVAGGEDVSSLKLNEAVVVTAASAFGTVGAVGDLLYCKQDGTLDGCLRVTARDKFQAQHPGVAPFAGGRAAGYYRFNLGAGTWTLVATNTVFDALVTETEHLIEALGTSAIRLHLYFWHYNTFDQQWPTLLPVHADFAAEIAALNALDVTACPYLISAYWWIENGQQPGDPFYFHDFDSFGDLSPYVFQTPDGVPNTGGPPFEIVFMDQGAEGTPDVLAAMARITYEGGAAGKGFYIDQSSGTGLPPRYLYTPGVPAFAAATLIFDQRPPAFAGNDGSFNQGKRAGLLRVRQEMRELVEDFVTVGESCEETLIGAVDSMGMISDQVYRARGQPCVGFSQVYSQYQRVGDLAIGTYPAFFPTSILANLAWITGATFHRGQPLAMNLLPLETPFEWPLVPDSLDDLFLRWMKAQIDARVWCHPYLNGEPLRALEHGWLPGLLASRRAMRAYLQFEFLAYRQDSVWRRLDTGGVGVVVTSFLDIATDLRIVLDEEGWPLPPGPKNLYRNDGTTRTLIATFETGLDLTVSITGPIVLTFEVEPA